ncbi:MAG TPA: type II toxin-antitoxin system RelE/ParE family toxin [Alphaproteobacteria bacterium]|nr:type II toxin-antitoxin system RelE/ParE family toxin [Alphaproteobacteria bacterium]
MRQVVYSPLALRQLEKIDSAWSRRIRAKIEQYAADPASLAPQVKTLKGSKGLRLRVGDYRVVFTADAKVLFIMKVGHRRDVYD